MVQSEGEVHIDTIWENCNPQNMMDSKLRCVNEMPEENVKLKENESKPNDPTLPKDTRKKNVSGVTASKLQHGVLLKKENISKELLVLSSLS